MLAAFHPPAIRLRVKVDDKVVNDLDTPVLMVALGNGAQVGGGHRADARGRHRGREAST